MTSISWPVYQLCGTTNITSPENYILCGAELDSTQRPANEKTLAPLPHIDTELNVLEIDPICKMEVDPKSAKWKSVYKGKEYYFCAPGCKKAFDGNPEKYVQ